MMSRPPSGVEYFLTSCSTNNLLCSHICYFETWNAVFQKRRKSWVSRGSDDVQVVGKHPYDRFSGITLSSHRDPAAYIDCTR